MQRKCWYLDIQHWSWRWMQLEIIVIIPTDHNCRLLVPMHTWSYLFDTVRTMQRNSSQIKSHVRKCTLRIIYKKHWFWKKTKHFTPCQFHVCIIILNIKQCRCTMLSLHWEWCRFAVGSVLWNRNVSVKFWNNASKRWSFRSSEYSWRSFRYLHRHR